MIEIASILKRFIDQAKTNNLKTSSYPKYVEELKINVSFGQGFPARIPWISFTIEPNTTSNGIYPAYLYFKSIDKIILAYGISETNKPMSKWKIDNSITISDFFKNNGFELPQRYGKSFFYKSYNVDVLDNELMSNDLNEIIKNIEIH
jgi:5-methylcytosine-specific restriction protein B